MIEFIGIILSLAYLGCILAIGELIRKFAKSENAKFISRKTVHILTCFLWFIIYGFLCGSYYPIALCGSLFVLLLIFHKRLPAISDAENKFSGALLYAGVGTALSAVCTFVPSLYIPLGITMCALSLGDGFAGIMGRLLPFPRISLYRGKTLCGTFAALCFAFLVLLGFTHGYGLAISPVEMLIIAVIFAFTELVTPFSADNISTSAVTFLLSALAISTNVLESYAFSLISIPITAVLVIKKRALTRGGIAAAVLVALAVIAGLGDYGFLLLFAFFALTTACDFVKKAKKQALLAEIHQKPFGRSSAQVLAVGLIPALAAMLALHTQNPVFTAAFAASIAESLGDCMASEIGVLSKKPPVDVFRRKRVAAGLSGGVSALGSVASIAGIAISSLIYLALPLYAKNTFLAVALSALLGVAADTALGSLAQRKNICPVCGKITERATHCSAQTAHHSGISWMSNTSVNFISNAFAASLAVLIYILQ